MKYLFPVTVFFFLFAGNSFSQLDKLPSEREGKFPVNMPNYEGVDQLLLLSNIWVIVVTDNMKDIVQNIDELSNGEYEKMLTRWENSEKIGKPDWTAYKARPNIFNQYSAKAREICGERNMAKTAYFKISSKDDSHYVKALEPLKVAKVIVGVGDQKVRGGCDPHFVYYSYLEMPKPLENGKTYSITLKNGRKVTFLYDEMRSVSRAIKVNQMGYLPDAKQKYAYLGCYLYDQGPMEFPGVKEFKVFDVNSGKEVYKGELKLRDKNSRVPFKPGKSGDINKQPLQHGENLYEIDLGPMKAEGNFFVSIPGVGRSWPFRHAKDAYGEAFFLATRGLYHQRCGIPYSKPYTKWERISCHEEPVYESEHIPFAIGNFDRPKKWGGNAFDVFGATIDTSKKTVDHVGGWHDAADWDRNVFHYSDVFDLLYSYEFAPKKFSDGQLNIPESGNGIPDILDEAEFGLNVWTKSMDEKGGVSGVVETWTHPTIDDKNVKYSYARRSRWTSLIYAAAAAQFAELVKPFDPAKSDKYQKLALKAYAYGIDPKNSMGKVKVIAKEKRGKGKPYELTWEEKDEYNYPFMAMAKLRLYQLTKDKKYLQDIPKLTEKCLMPTNWRYTRADFSPWLYYHIARGAADALPPEMVKKWRDFYLKSADDIVKQINEPPYRKSWPVYQDFWMGWGAAHTSNFNRMLLIASSLTDDKKYRDAALLNMDFMYGANPMGMSWTTGIGYVYPVDIQHAVSDDDKFLDPVPGLTIYGITGGMYSDLRHKAWAAPKGDGSKEEIKFFTPDIPLWRRWSCHPRLNVGQCEFTIHETMAANILNSAWFLSEGWQPSDDLKSRGPKEDKYVFGYYYLP